MASHTAGNAAYDLAGQQIENGMSTGMGQAGALASAGGEEVLGSLSSIGAKQIVNLLVGLGEKGSFDVNKAVKRLNENAHEYSQHACAKYVRLALVAGGINTDPHPISAKNYTSYLLKWGFEIIKDKESYLPQKGDIRVFQPYKGGSVHGHIDMYNGNQWVSDFFENGDFPGSGYKKDNNFQIFRWIIIQ